MGKTTLTAAEQSRQVLTEAQAKLTTCQALNEQAEAHAAALLARIDAADTTVTAVEWTTVQADQEIASKLVAAAENRVRIATSRLINDDYRLAEGLADVLRSIYGRFVEIRLVSEDHLITQPEDPRDSVIFVNQRKATTDNGGIWSGDLSVTYFRSAVMSPLDGEEIERACRSRDWAVSVRNVSSWEMGDGQHQCTAQVEVRGIYRPVPTLAAAPTEDVLGDLARTVSGRLYLAVRVNAPRLGIRLSGEPIQRNAFADVKGVEIIGSTEIDGEHRTTVEMAFAVKPDDDLRGIPRDLLNAAADGCVGLADPGTGSIAAVESFDFRTVKNEINGQPAYIESAARYVVVVRFAVAYRIG